MANDELDRRLQEIETERKYRVEERTSIVEEAKGPDRLPGLLSADDILSVEFPEPVWVVPGLLPIGLTILAGRPKTGKSWLCLQIARAVVSGGYALDQKVDPGRVLVVALEDHPRRLQDRMRKQGWITGLPADFITPQLFRQSIGDLSKSGGKALAKEIEKWGYRFVVVDTFSKAIGGIDQSDVAKVTCALGPLQEVAQTLSVAVMIVDHHHKGMGDPNAVSDILGSTGKSAIADCLWGLYREQGKAGAKLMLTGRDIEERTLAVTMDWETGIWQCEGEANLYELTGREAEFIRFLEDAGPSGIMDIAAALGMEKGNAYAVASNAVNKGRVVKMGKGRGNVKYTIPGDKE